MREIVNAIFHVLRGGVAWRLLPKDFPLWQTVYGWFARLCDGRVFERMNNALVMADRRRAGRSRGQPQRRNRSPSAPMDQI